MYVHTRLYLHRKPVERQEEIGNRVVFLRKEVQENFFNLFLHVLDFEKLGAFCKSA